MSSTSADNNSKQQSIWQVLRRISWSHTHGMGGIAYVLLCLIEVVQFVISKSPYLPLSIALVVVSTLFTSGLFTKRFQLKRKTLGTKRFVFYRAALWTVAFSSQLVSIYTLPAGGNGSFVPLKDAPFPYQMGTVFYLVATCAALGVAQHEIRNCTIYAPAFPIANMLSNLILLTMPVLHACVGESKLAEYYDQYLVGETVYILSLWTGFVTAWDTFGLGLFTANRITRHHIQVLVLFDWVGLFSLSLAGFMWWLHGFGMAQLWLLMICLMYGSSTQIDKLLVYWGVASFKV